MIDYGDSEDAWRDAKATIQRRILETGATRVLEVGAGANPTFEPEFLGAHGIDYTALDISAGELAKAPDCYRKVVADICSPDLDIEGNFDFVFSRMLAEHIPDGRRFHGNILRLLAPGGRAFHFFPTLWAWPFVVNRILPERLAEALLHIMQRGREREGNLAKFPAFYSWCRGPTQAQLQRFRSLGFEIEQYTGFFGHRGYYQKFPPLLRLHDLLSGYLRAHPLPWMTSFAYVTLRRPD